MPLNVSERNALVRAILLAFGEDYQAMAKLIHFLRLELPAVDWPTVLATLAASWQPFIDSGLSITWWVNEVMRLADAME